MEDVITKDEIENLDYKKVSSIQQKRTLAFFNHFIFTTVQFLNNFIKTCEQKLINFERKLEKVEAAVVLLETRLSSIPEVNKISIQVQETVYEPEPLSKENELEPLSKENEQTSAPITDPAPSIAPEYDKFIKMVSVGVPLAAVKLKLSLEGLDPNILEKALKK